MSARARPGLAACGALLIVAACADGAATRHAPGERDGPGGGADVEDGRPGPGPLDALTRRFGRLRARMAERGYGEARFLDRVFVLEFRGLAIPLDLPTGRCTTFVALGGSGVRDLSLALYDGAGDEVATDSVPGEGGLVHVCPQALPGELDTAPHYLSIRAVEGAGAVVGASFTKGTDTGAGFDGLFDGVLAPAVPFREVEERLARARTVLRSRGMLPLAEPVLGSRLEGDLLRVVVEVEPGRCYVALARGDEGLTDIDLLLFDPSGAEVARDLHGDAEPSIEVCPDEVARYAFVARAYAGSGALGLQVLGGPAPAQEAPSQAGAEAHAEQGEGEAPADAATDPDVAIAATAAALAERGYAAPVRLSARALLSPGEVRVHELSIGPGCAVVIGATGSSDSDLDLYLTDAAGVPIDRDTGIQPLARVRACTSEPSTLRVTAKAYGRRSTYALAVVAAPSAIADVRTLRLEEATAMLRQRAYQAGAERLVELDEGERTSERVVVPPGTCVAFAVAGDVGVSDVDLHLYDDAGALVASASGPEPHGAVWRCAEEGALSLRAEVVLYRGAGTVALARLHGGAP